MKFIFKIAFITTALLLFTTSIDAKIKGKHRQRTNAAQTMKLPANINELMRFTDTYNNRGSRFVTLADFPTSNACIKTVAKQNDNLVDFKIYINQQFFQRFKFRMTLPYDIEIHYLDANFDGYTDIFVGKNEMYADSGVYLWNPDSKNFEKADFRFKDVFVLDPTNKFCYNWYNDFITYNCYKYCWEARKLKCIEFVMSVFWDNNVCEYFVGTGDLYNSNFDPFNTSYNQDGITIKYKTFNKDQLPLWYKLISF